MHVSYSTGVAGYCNSLLSLAQFASTVVHESVDDETDDAIASALIILRSQAEKQHRDDRRWARFVSSSQDLVLLMVSR